MSALLSAIDAELDAATRRVEQLASLRAQAVEITGVGEGADTGTPAHVGTRTLDAESDAPPPVVQVGALPRAADHAPAREPDGEPSSAGRDGAGASSVPGGTQEPAPSPNGRPARTTARGGAATITTIVAALRDHGRGTGVEYREITRIRITRRDTPKGVAVATAPCTLDTLDEAARQLLKVIR